MDPGTVPLLVLSRADDWRWVGGAFAVALVAHFLPRIGPAVSGLLLPTGLLLLRKLFLFLPIPGALSTADRVIFWSMGTVAYFVFLGLFLFLGTVLVRSKMLDDDFPMVVLLAPAVGSAVLLPIEGFWSHMIMPFVVGAAIPKILLVHPLLLPAALAGLAGQVCLTLLWGGSGAREVNKLLLAVLLVGGLVYTALSVATVGVAREALGSTTETTGFLHTWAEKLDGIAECGANLVEGNHESVYTTCRIRRLAQEMTAAASPPLSLPALWAGAALGLLLLGLVERCRWPTSWRDAPWSRDNETDATRGEG